MRQAVSIIVPCTWLNCWTAALAGKQPLKIQKPGTVVPLWNIMSEVFIQYNWQTSALHSSSRNLSLQWMAGGK